MASFFMWKISQLKSLHDNDLMQFFMSKIAR